MELFIHWDLFALILTLASIGTLGFVVFLSDTRNSTNRVFLIFATATILWGSVNYLSYNLSNPQHALLVLRFAIFFAVWHAYSFYLLMNVFPSKKFEFSLKQKVILGISIFTSLFNLSPYVFSKIEKIGDGNGVAPTATGGPGISVFVLFVLFLIISGFYALLRRYNRGVGVERSQLSLLLIGSTATFMLLLIFNLVLPVFFSNVAYIPFGALFILPLIIFTSYAIYRYNLFDLKLVATEIFVGILSVIFFAKMISAPTNIDRVTEIVIFVSTIFFGALLVRSVKEEIEGREKIRLLAKRLSETNFSLAKTNEQLRIIDQRKSEFISIVSHQLRTPITAIKGYTSLILEESYGKFPDSMKIPLERIFISSDRLAKMITEFLNISKIEQGTMAYNIVPVDIGLILDDLSDDFEQIVEDKNLELHVHISNGDKYIALADEGKIRQILSNLIDNAIKYSQHGEINIFTKKDAERNIIEIKIVDTGIGLSQDDIHHLFGKFTRGSGGQGQNTEGSGLGLYVAKKMLESQNGKIWVDSPGPGKGSTFIVELPMSI